MALVGLAIFGSKFLHIIVLHVIDKLIDSTLDADHFVRVNIELLYYLGERALVR